MCPPTRKVLIRAYRGRGPIGLAIRWQTRSPYSHVALQFGNLIVESHARTGVQSRFVAESDAAADVFSVEMHEQYYHQIFAWAQSHVGDRYDWLAILRFVSRQRCWSDSRWFCSELVFSAFLAGGIRLLERTEEWEVSPGLLVRSPLLTREPK